MKTSFFLISIVFGFKIITLGQWSQMDLSSPRAYMGAAVLGSKAYLAGGQNSTGLKSIIEVYDASTGGLTSLPGGLSVARDLPFATTCGSKIIFAGGADFFNTQNVYSTVDIFDTVNQQWSVEQLSVPRLQAAVVSHGDTVLFAGGANLQQQISYDVVDIYNVQTGVWSTATLSEPRTTWWATVGDLAIFAGGYDFPTASKRVDIFNFSTGTWSIDSLSVARAFVGMVTIGNKVLIAGGINNDNQPSDVVDIYDAVTGTWDIGYLSAPRAFCDNQNAVSSCGKAVFIGGGYLNLNGAYWYYTSDVIDIYDPGTDTWSTDTLNQSFVHRAAVSLGDHFLVAGGVSLNLNYTSEIDVYACPENCLPQGIYLNTQAEIDNYRFNHPGCTAIEGNVTISGSNITNLNGLNELTSIGGNLKIYGTSLTSMSGLNSLSTIAGSLQIGISDFGCNGNDQLINFDGLEELSSIGENLIIICNELLTELSGIDSLNFIRGDLTIHDNDLLENCAIQSVCSIINNPEAEINIHDNAPGCNSKEEVVAACITGVGQLDDWTVGQLMLEVYPNPTSGIVDFRLPLVKGRWSKVNGQWVSLKVYNTQGQEVATLFDGRWKGDQVIRWDTGGFPAGIYYYRLSTVNCQLPTETGKIVKL